MKNIARRPRLSLLTCCSIRFRLQARSPSEMSRDGETQPSLAIAPSASSFIRRELRQYRDGKSHFTGDGVLATFDGPAWRGFPSVSRTLLRSR